MNLSQIISQALEQSGSSSDAQMKDEYRKTFEAYANEAQLDLALSIRQFRTDSLSISDGKVNLLLLPKECVKVLSVKKSGTSYSFFSGETRTELVLSGISAGNVDITYRYVPSNLGNDQDIPDIPVSMHGLIPVYMAARENTGKDPQRAAALMDVYERGKRLALASIGGSDSFAIINKW